MKIGQGVSELWGVENRPLPLTWPMAYTTACTTVQAVIIIVVYYATQATHRIHAQNKETIKHEKTKSTNTKMTKKLWCTALSQHYYYCERASVKKQMNPKFSNQ